MSGPLVGLVHDHGPRDHNAWAVLVVIAERLHGPTRSYDATTEALAHDARLSPSSAKRGVAVLVAEGWVKRTPGRWKGHASTYWLDLTAFPEDAVDDTLAALAKGVTQTPSRDSTGGHTDPLREPKGVTQTAKGVTQTQHAVPVQEAGGRARVEVAVDNPMPGVLMEAPRPCKKHPNGWHHDEPCRACKALREYDEQQQAAAPRMRDRRPDELCGDCDHGWIETRNGVIACPNGCLERVPITDSDDDDDQAHMPAPVEARRRLTDPEPIGGGYAAAATTNAERLATVGESPAFDPFRKRTRRTS